LEATDEVDQVATKATTYASRYHVLQSCSSPCLRFGVALDAALGPFYFSNISHMQEISSILVQYT
jgi:hypothetical protein